MTYTNFVMTHSRDGFAIWREERHYWKDILVEIADNICKWTGHRWCHRFSAVWDWADEGTRRSEPVMISDEMALALSNSGDWDFLDKLEKL